MSKTKLHLYLSTNGKKGSDVQKKRHKKKLSEWGKLGGRPRKQPVDNLLAKASR